MKSQAFLPLYLSIVLLLTGCLGQIDADADEELYDVPAQTIELTIDAADEIMLNGRSIEYSLLAQELHDLQTDASTYVVLRIDDRVEMGTYHDLLEILRQAGMARIKHSSSQERPEAGHL
jgi:biopolymer transport protein ExbD